MLSHHVIQMLLHSIHSHVHSTLYFNAVNPTYALHAAKAVIWSDKMTGKRLRNAFTVPPAQQPTEPKPGQLTKDQLDQFFNEGFVIVKDIIDTKTLEDVKREWEAEVKLLSWPNYYSGRIGNTVK